MNKVKLLVLFLSVISILFPGCVKSGRNFVVDKQLLEEQHSFKTSQEPAFTMDIPEGAEFKKMKLSDVNDIDGSWSDRLYFFRIKNPDYILMVEMETVYEAVWGVGQPWTNSLGKEIHGAKPFSCGTGVYKKKKKITDTYKAWMYSPGGDGFYGSTRITVYYLEDNDQTGDMEAFIHRADSRTKFRME